MTDRETAASKAATAYNAASDRYDAPALSFWSRFGESTVRRMGLKNGAAVLDVCCGTGASAIPAARSVGPAANVLAVDLADRLLAVGKAKAEALGLENLTFQPGNMLELGFPDRSFDAVICVFGIFFVPDMPDAARELWRMVRPGGQLAITTWGPDLFEPANGAFWNAVRRIRPELYKSFNPWDRICTPASLREMLAEGGVSNAQVEPEAVQHPLTRPDDWWTIVMGSGYRGTVELLTEEERVEVRRQTLDALRKDDVRSIVANVVYANAPKP